MLSIERINQLKIVETCGQCEDFGTTNCLYKGTQLNHIKCEPYRRL